MYHILTVCTATTENPHTPRLLRFLRLTLQGFSRKQANIRHTYTYYIYIRHPFVELPQSMCMCMYVGRQNRIINCQFPKLPTDFSTPQRPSTDPPPSHHPIPPHPASSAPLLSLIGTLSLPPIRHEREHPPPGSHAQVSRNKVRPCELIYKNGKKPGLAHNATNGKNQDRMAQRGEPKWTSSYYFI